MLYKYIWHNIDTLGHIYSQNGENETNGPNQNGSIGSRLQSHTWQQFSSTILCHNRKLWLFSFSS